MSPTRPAVHATTYQSARCPLFVTASKDGPIDARPAGADMTLCQCPAEHFISLASGRCTEYGVRRTAYGHDRGTTLFPSCPFAYSTTRPQRRARSARSPPNIQSRKKRRCRLRSPCSAPTKTPRPVSPSPGARSGRRMGADDRLGQKSKAVARLFGGAGRVELPARTHSSAIPPGRSHGKMCGQGKVAPRAEGRALDSVQLAVPAVALLGRSGSPQI